VARNAYVEPLVSLDLDIAVAVEEPRTLIEGLRASDHRGLSISPGRGA
jgi:hypothetical protein